MSANILYKLRTSTPSPLFSPYFLKKSTPQSQQKNIRKPQDVYHRKLNFQSFKFLSYKKVTKSLS